MSIEELILGNLASLDETASLTETVIALLAEVMEYIILHLLVVAFYAPLLRITLIHILASNPGHGVIVSAGQIQVEMVLLLSLLYLPLYLIINLLQRLKAVVVLNARLWHHQLTLLAGYLEIGTFCNVGFQLLTDKTTELYLAVLIGFLALVGAEVLFIQARPNVRQSLLVIIAAVLEDSASFRLIPALEPALTQILLDDTLHLVVAHVGPHAELALLGRWKAGFADQILAEVALDGFFQDVVAGLAY